MDNIIKIGQIVKCIRGAIGLLENGKEYTIYGVTNSGNYLLMEVDPTAPCNCFDSSRFELTDRFHIFDFPESDYFFSEHIEQ